MPIETAALNGTARVYYVEIDAEVVPLCERPES
jgi:spermidine synthase